MNKKYKTSSRATKSSALHPQQVLSTSELLIMADGKILAHNITPSLANLLSELNPNDILMKERSYPDHQTGASSSLNPSPRTK